MIFLLTWSTRPALGGLTRIQGKANAGSDCTKSCDPARLIRAKSRSVQTFGSVSTRSTDCSPWSVDVPWLWKLWLALWALIAMPWATFDGVARWERVIWSPVTAVRPRDAILNLLFCIPFGFCGAKSGWSFGAVVLAGAGLSMSTEFLQVFSAGRWPSASDVVMNVSGFALGAYLVRVNARRPVAQAPARRQFRVTSLSHDTNLRAPAA